MSVTVRSAVLPEFYVDRSKQRPQNEQAEPPTLEYLQGLETELRRQYADDDEQIIRTRQVRTLKRPVEMPKRFRLVDVEVRDPTVADEIQRTVATLSINPPKLTIKSGDSQAEQENAAKRKHWTEEVMRVCGARETGRSAFVDCVDQCVGDGGAWLKVVLSPDLWEKRYALDLRDFGNDDGDGYSDEALGNFGKAAETAKKQSGPPFAISCPDVLTVYPVWYGDQLGEVLEVQSRPMHSTFRQYRLTRGADNKILYSEEVGQATSTVNQRLYPMYAKPIKVYEHWDRNFVTMAVADRYSRTDAGVNGRVVKQWKHGYGRPPYFFAPGLMMGWFANKKVGWGVSESKRWLVEYRSFLWTLHAQVCARDAMNPIFREVPADSAPVMGIDGRPRDKEVWQPGDIINGRPGEKLTPIEFPDVAESLQEQIKLTGEAIAMLTSPRVSANIGEGVEGAGFAINQQLEEARTRHDPFAQSIENAWTEATRFVWWLVINKVNETVWVYQNGANSGWLSAGPKDLDSTVGISWRLDPAMASAKLIESRYWNERVAAGTASKDMAIEALGDSPSEVRLGQTLDRMRASPWFQKFQDQKVLQRLGRGDILNQAAVAANLVATGQFPTGIPPVGIPGQSGPPAMGTQAGPPDMGALAAAPNGGPAPQPMPVPPGGISGTGPGLVVPNASAAPMAQGLGR